VVCSKHTSFDGRIRGTTGGGGDLVHFLIKPKLPKGKLKPGRTREKGYERERERQRVKGKKLARNVSCVGSILSIL